MSIIKSFRSYLLEDDFCVHLYKNRVNIINYSTIGHISDNEIIVYFDNGMLIIKGNNLSLLKMIEDELLISGTIKSVELR